MAVFVLNGIKDSEKKKELSEAKWRERETLDFFQTEMNKSAFLLEIVFHKIRINANRRDWVSLN